MWEGTVTIMHFNLPFEHFPAVITGCDDENYYAQTETDVIKISKVGSLLLWSDENSLPCYCTGQEHNVFDLRSKEPVPIYCMKDGKDYYWLRQEVYRHEIEYRRRVEQESVLDN